MRRSLVAVLLGMTLAGAAQAHPLAPALLELTETGPQRYAVLWRTPVVRAGNQDVAPQLPAQCAPIASPDSRMEGGDALATRWLVQCTAPLDGAQLSVQGLAGSGINVVVRVSARDGRQATGLLGADQPALTVSLARESIFARYLRLGGEHLLTGFDHLLFLLGLFVLVPTLRSLVATVTAFTLGHSLTLAAAVLGWLQVRQDWAELAIAATLVVLALELIRPPAPNNVLSSFPARNVLGSFVGRRPWLMAGLFGLVHGLGFAGALREVGVPAGEIPMSLLAFNVGIEAGQLAVIAGLLVATAVWRTMPRPSRLKPLLQVPAYLIGAMGACWCLERSLQLFA